MELKDLPGIARLNIGSGWRSHDNLKISMEVMEEFASNPLYAEFRDDFLVGIEFCKERLAVMEHCATCGAER